MRFSIPRAIPLLSLFSAIAFSQTSSDCNPLNVTCPPNTALGVSNYTIDFTQNVMSSRVWNTTSGSIASGDAGAEFTINQRGDGPTTMTKFYMFFGQLEVIMKTAKGQGVVSSIVLLSDDLDEVDWEWIGGNNSYVQTNYFGKGNQTSFDRAIWHPVTDPQDTWHNYTVDWSREKLDWYVDGKVIRTLKYEEANGGKNFPQTPCNVRLGIWAGGDPKNPKGTIEWAGGVTDYNKGPYTMTVKSVRVSDASTGTQYEYGDHSGSFQSIKSLNTTKPLKLDGANGDSSTQSAKQKWNHLSQTSRIAIIASVGGFLVVCACIFGFCCIKQRRAGKHEKLVEDAKFEKDAAELMAYRAQMGRLRSEKLAADAVRVTPVGGGGGGGYGAQPLLSSTASVRSAATGVSGVSGAGYQYGYPAANAHAYAQTQAQAQAHAQMMNNNSYNMPNYPPMNGGYAPSMHSMGSGGGGYGGQGRGYQRY